MSFEPSYIRHLEQVMQNGDKRDTRAGPARSLFGKTLFIDDMENDRFPILTTRRMFIKPILGELAAFIRGAEYVRIFHEFGCKYWDDNAKAWEENKEWSDTDNMR